MWAKYIHTSHTSPYNAPFIVTTCSNFVRLQIRLSSWVVVASSSVIIIRGKRNDRSIPYIYEVTFMGGSTVKTAIWTLLKADTSVI